MTLRRPRRDNQAGLTLAMLALVLRVLVAGLPGMGSVAATDVAGVLAAVPICHAGVADGSDPAPNTPAEPGHDCALCPACAAAAMPAVMPGTTWAVVAVPPPRVAFAVTPPPTGPPSLHRAAANPRGPPTAFV